MKFHVTEDGPKKCSAKPGNCPIGGEHYGDEVSARTAFEKLQDSSLPAHSKKSGLPHLSVTTRVQPFAGGHYFGCHVEKSTVQEYLTAFRDQVGVGEAVEMEQSKAARDRGYVYHVTTIRPPEMRQVKGGLTPAPESVTVDYKGLGKARDGDNEAWFIVCESAEINDWRGENNLPPIDLHVTLAFKNKDVHNQPKGEESIVVHAD